ncbi:MAG: hypothetical protein ACXVQY_08655 [Actinomycetota bacterium]
MKYEAIVTAVTKLGVSVEVEDLDRDEQQIVGELWDGDRKVEFIFSADGLSPWDASIDLFSSEGVFLASDCRDGPAVDSPVAVVAEWIVSVMKEDRPQTAAEPRHVAVPR